MDYETGVGLSLLVGYGRLGWAFFTQHSLFHTNLGRAGLRQKWTTGQIVDLPSDAIDGRISKSYRTWRLILSVFVIVPITGVLSWLGLILSSVMFIKGTYSEIMAPSYVKECRWKLRHVYLTGEQVKALFKDLEAKLLNTSLSDVKTDVA
ncbi:MAG: hypothetical protein EOP09_00270 [Proteobacteria bacterium]|nr:MAG: hypothetical protein EOP09_00270 [Pseudomonadota bacterium]